MEEVGTCRGPEGSKMEELVGAYVQQTDLGRWGRLRWK